MTPTEERADLEQAVTETMANAIELDRWNVAPALWLWLGDGEDMTFMPMPGFAVIMDHIDGNLREAPQLAAKMVRKAREDGVTIFDEVATTPGLHLVGVMLAHEGYGFTPETIEANREEIAAYMEGGGRIADHPLGCETRNIVVVGTGSYVFMSVHYRGDEQARTISSADRGGPTASGYLVEGLRDLRTAVSEELTARAGE